MLTDPLVLITTAAAVTPSGGGFSFARTDPGSIVGRTVRQNGAYTLSFQHSPTKENKPFGTKRVTIRLDQVIPASSMDPSLVASAVSGAQLTFIQPNGESTNSSVALARLLGRLVLFGDYVASARSESDGLVFCNRLLVGEG